MKDVYLLKQDGSIVCCVYLLGPPSDGIGLITSVWTHPEFRGNGLASELLRLVLSDADDDNVQLWLKIEPDNLDDFDRLAEWYARLGFTEIDILDPTRVRNPRSLQNS